MLSPSKTALLVLGVFSFVASSVPTGGASSGGEIRKEANDCKAALAEAVKLTVGSLKEGDTWCPEVAMTGLKRFESKTTHVVDATRIVGVSGHMTIGHAKKRSAFAVRFDADFTEEKGEHKFHPAPTGKGFHLNVTNGDHKYAIVIKGGTETEYRDCVQHLTERAHLDKHGVKHQNTQAELAQNAAEHMFGLSGEHYMKCSA